MREIYLDNAATTPVLPEVLEAMKRALCTEYGNPSSLHRKGVEAENGLKRARETIAGLLRVKAQEIFFTSGGTEANNLLIKGIARRYRRRGRHLITTVAEHPSVLNCFQALAKEGFQVTFLDVNGEGRIDPARLADALTADTVLVSIMHVNNEIGTIQPLEEAARVVKQYSPQILFHTDAVQSFGKLPCYPAAWRIDALSLSAHKLHGPKGCGAVYLREGVLLDTLFNGGGQEDGLRPGTENTPGIAGLQRAAELCGQKMHEHREKLYRLKTAFYSEVAARVRGVRLNGPPLAAGAPHILNLSFPGVKGEVLLHALEAKGVFASAGSACHSRRPEPSHVLKAIGLADKELVGALRFSFSPLNTPGDIRRAAEIIEQCLAEITAL